jgi:DNA mismatch repair protein MutS
VLLDAPKRVARSAFMQIDQSTRESLELTRSAVGAVAGSLLGESTAASPPGAGDCSPSDVSAPLTEKDEIDRRLAMAVWFHGDQLRRERTRTALKAIPDIARALGRLTAGRGSPRDLAQLRDGLSAADALRRELEASPTCRRCSCNCCPSSAVIMLLIDKLAAALVSSPPLDASKGGYIADDYDPQLDSLRLASSDGRGRSRRSKRDIASRPGSRR